MSERAGNDARRNVARAASTDGVSRPSSGIRARPIAARPVVAEEAPRNRRTRAPEPRAEPLEDTTPRTTLKERMSARRDRAAKVLRAVGERLRRPVILLAKLSLVAALAAGGVALYRLVERHARTSPSFAITEIAVDGEGRLSEDAVRELAGLSLGQNVFEVAPEEARAALREHPWIADAEVTRRLPGTYAITITERVAAAMLVLDAPYLVADDGAVFKRWAEGDPVDLPVITGIERDRFVTDRAFRTQVLVEVVGLFAEWRGAGLWRREPIAEVHVERDDALTLFLGEDATEVRLGHGPFRAKLDRLRSVLDELQSREADAAYVYLDNVRRPDRVIVRVR